MPDSRKTYGGARVEVSFDSARCRHAAECVRGLPDVFDVDRRPWVLPDADDPQRVVEVVARCPTGALRTAVRDAAVAPEAAAVPTRVQVVPSGPLVLRGDLEIDGERETRAALCRCGTTANVPYCDGSGPCADWHGG